MWGPFSRTPYSRYDPGISIIIISLGGLGEGTGEIRAEVFWPNPFHFIDEPEIESRQQAATKIIVTSPGARAVAELPGIPPEMQVERVVDLNYGDEALCRKVGESLLDRWRHHRVTITGTIALNVGLSFKSLYRVKIPTAAVDGLFILHSMNHDLARYTTKVVLGDMSLTDEELIARILQEL